MAIVAGQLLVPIRNDKVDITSVEMATFVTSRASPRGTAEDHREAIAITAVRHFLVATVGKTCKAETVFTSLASRSTALNWAVVLAPEVEGAIKRGTSSCLVAQSLPEAGGGTTTEGAQDCGEGRVSFTPNEGARVALRRGVNATSGAVIFIREVMAITPSGGLIVQLRSITIAVAPVGEVRAIFLDCDSVLVGVPRVGLRRKVKESSLGKTY